MNVVLSAMMSWTSNSVVAERYEIDRRLVSKWKRKFEKEIEELYMLGDSKKDAPLLLLRDKFMQIENDRKGKFKR